MHRPYRTASEVVRKKPSLFLSAGGAFSGRKSFGDLMVIAMVPAGCSRRKGGRLTDSVVRTWVGGERCLVESWSQLPVQHVTPQRNTGSAEEGDEPSICSAESLFFSRLGWERTIWFEAEGPRDQHDGTVVMLHLQLGDHARTQRRGQRRKQSHCQQGFRDERSHASPST